MTYASLCTGLGQLDRAVEAMFGGTLAWYSETDKDACAVLARRYPGVPNLGDLTAVAWSGVAPVDLICAGPPCQAVSVAGKRKGDDDERFLWPAVLRCVEHMRPRSLVFENPPGLAPWLPAILCRLAALGYVGRYGRLAAGRADDDERVHVGACHQRERYFIAAHASSEPGRLQPVGLAGRSGASAASDAGAKPVAEPHGEGCAEVQWLQGSGASGGGDGPASDADGAPGNPRRWPDGALRRPEAIERRGRSGAGSDFPWGRYSAAIIRHERTFGRAAPWPLVEGTRSLSGDFCGWMMDVEEGTLDGISNTAKKRLCGNAVVARQAEAALRMLVVR